MGRSWSERRLKLWIGHTATPWGRWNGLVSTARLLENRWAFLRLAELHRKVIWRLVATFRLVSEALCMLLRHRRSLLVKMCLERVHWS